MPETKIEKTPVSSFRSPQHPPKPLLLSIPLPLPHSAPFPTPRRCRA